MMWYWLFVLVGITINGVSVCIESIITDVTMISSDLTKSS